MNALRAAWLALLLVPAGAGADWVKYGGGRLSVEFSGMELQEVLDMLSQETGVKFSASSTMAGTVRDRFSELPLEAGLRRLLKGYNYILVFAESPPRPLEQVILLPKYSGVPAAARSSPVKDTAEGAEIILPKDDSGHYLAAGQINGQPVELLVDTGATSVTVPGALAKEMNLVSGPERTVTTANGQAKGFATELETLTIAEGVVLRQVPAIILPDMDTGRRVLLGMNVLRGFDLSQQDDKLVIRSKGQ